MKKTCLAIISVMIFAAAFPQKRDTIWKYLDQNLEFTSKRKMKFVAAAVEENDHWNLLSVYPEGTLLMRTYYKDKALKIKDGPFSLYFKNKKIATHGFYHENNAIGIWENWYNNGQMRDSGFFDNNMREGRWLYWYDNGNLESDGHYSKDSVTGEWKWYREDGTLSTKEKYENGKLTDLECYNEKGEMTGPFCSIQKPLAFTDPGYGSLYDYVMLQLQEKDRRKVDTLDAVTVSFSVDENGNVTDISFTEPADENLKELITDILENCKKLSPAISHNRFIKTSASFSVDPKLFDR